MSDSELAVVSLDSFSAPALITRARFDLAEWALLMGAFRYSPAWVSIPGQPNDPQKVLRIFYGADPQRQYTSRLLPGNPTVSGLGRARWISAARRHRAHHGGRLHRNLTAPGRAAHGQTAHGGD